MATVPEIQGKIEKTKQDIQKRQERDLKLKERAAKFSAKIEKEGISVPEYTMDDFRSSRVTNKNTYGRHWLDRYTAGDFFDAYLRRELGSYCWDIIRDKGQYDNWYSFESAVKDQCDNNNKLYELEDKLTRLEADKQRAVVKQQEVEDIPPILKDLQQEIKKELLETYRSIKEKIISYKQRMRENPTFRKQILEEAFFLIGKSNYMFFKDKADEDIEKLADKESEFYVLDIINRVTKKVGEIIDYRDVYVNGPAINGTITGDRGSTRLQTIVASGPIQRPHYRVLLK